MRTPYVPKHTSLKSVGEALSKLLGADSSSLRLPSEDRVVNPDVRLHTPVHEQDCVDVDFYVSCLHPKISFSSDRLYRAVRVQAKTVKVIDDTGWCGWWPKSMFKEAGEDNG